MGALDDAIREHLELRRRQGLSEDEVRRKEDEAFGRRSPLSRDDDVAESPPALDSSEASATEHEEVLEGSPAEPAAPESAAASPEPSPAVDPADLEPDEVLPEESLELEHALLDEQPAADGEGAVAADPDWDRVQQVEEEPGEDLLEETPDFLEETPEQDRLWFEQRPPKDFDFGD
jgi:hypothetical protein